VPTELGAFVYVSEANSHYLLLPVKPSPAQHGFDVHGIIKTVTPMLSKEQNGRAA
jgi:hypothetical protein